MENIQGGTKVFGSCSSKEKQQQEQRVEAIECKRTSRATFAHAQILLALACVTEWRNSWQKKTGINIYIYAIWLIMEGLSFLPKEYYIYEGFWWS